MSVSPTNSRKLTPKATRLRGLLPLTTMLLLLPLAGFAQIVRTPWQMFDTNTVVSFPNGVLGDTNAYPLAIVPAPNAVGWVPAPNTNSIGFNRASVSGVDRCNGGHPPHTANFTYFQCFLFMPSNYTVTALSISLTNVDDGDRVSLYNSTYPNGGIVLPGSYFFYDTPVDGKPGWGTVNLASLFKVGETNRLVITHQDNCSSGSVVSNNAFVFTGFPTNLSPPVALCTNVTIVLGTNSSACATNASVDNGSYTPNGGSITIAQVPPSPYPIGTNVVTLWVTDTFGMSNSCTATVLVLDAKPPTIACPADLIVTNSPGSCLATNVSLGVPITSDCTTVTATNDAPVSFPVGTNIVTWTAQDTSGNTNTCRQIVIVRDVQAPTIACPGNLTLNTDPGQCSAGNVTYLVTFSDNCPDATLAQTAGLPSGATFPAGTTTNRFVVTDASGNTNTCSFTVTVTDNEAPAIICPVDVIVSADTNSCAATGVSLGSPVTGDNCGVAGVVSNAPASFAVGTNTVLWTATDTSGNTNTCSQLVIVQDTQIPTIVCPADLTTTNSLGTNVALDVILELPTVADNCGVSSVSSNAPAVYPVGTNLIIWTVVDIHGNSNSCAQQVIVSTNATPSLTCPDEVTVFADSNSCFATGVNLGSPTVTFAGCGGVVVTSNAPAQFPLGTNVVTWTATDQCGAVNGCQQRVIVLDNQAPTISCPANLVLSTDPGQCSRSNVTYTVTFDDNCVGALLTQTTGLPSGSAFPKGTTTNRFTVTDASGNTNECMFTVTINDTEPPAITCPADVIVAANDGCAATNVTLGTPLTSDNCSVASVTNNLPALNPIAWWPGQSNTVDIVNGHDGVWQGTAEYATGKVGGAFSLDGSSGLNVGGPASFQVQDFTIETWVKRASTTLLTQTPWPFGYDNNGVLFSSGAYSGYVWGLDSAGRIFFGKSLISEAGRSTTAITDTNYHHVALTKSGSTVRYFIDGVLQNTFTYTDVFDMTTNAAVGMHPVIGQNAFYGAIDDMAFYTNVLSTNDIAAIYAAGVAGKCGTPTPPTVCATGNFTLGTNLVTWTVTDTSGNTNTCTQRVIVMDNQPPAISCAGDLVFTTDPGQCSRSNVTYTVTFSDNCSGAALTQTAGLASGAAFPKGTTTNRFTVTDAGGNTNACFFTVQVNDPEPPVITCPADFTTNTVPGGTAVTNLALGVPVTADNCAVASVTNNAPVILPVGTNVVTWIVADTSGNFATCMQRVIVVSACAGGLTATAITNVTVCAGHPAGFTTVAASQDPLAFTWKFNGQTLAGQTNHSLLLPSVGVSNAGLYTVEVRTDCGGAALTNSATLTVLPSPNSNPVAYTNAAGITINTFGVAAPYGSVITPQCVPGVVQNLTVRLHGFTHTFPRDASVLLLSPDGRAVMLLAGAGGGNPLNVGVDLLFTDASNILPPEAGLLTNGVYHPADYLTNLTLPAPVPARPYATNLATFNGVDPNGSWSLFVYDNSPGDGGSIVAWSLNLEWVDTNSVTGLALQNPRRLGNGAFQAEVLAPTNQPSVVQWTTNLVEWTPLLTNVFSNYPGIFTDGQSTPFNHRFYRAVLLP